MLKTGPASSSSAMLLMQFDGWFVQEVFLDHLAYIRWIVERIHFLHPFSEKAGSIVWQIQNHFIEYLFHQTGVMGTRCYYASIDMQQAPGPINIVTLQVMLNFIRAGVKV